jgi:hypothetical protein
LWILAFFRRGRNSIKTNIGKEYCETPFKTPLTPLGAKGVVIKINIENNTL